MTLDEFRATGRDVSDIGLEIGWDDALDGKPGRVYGTNGTLYIQDTTGWAHDSRGGSGRWYLMVERSEYRSDDLASLERVLYEWTVGQGYWIQD